MRGSKKLEESMCKDFNLASPLFQKKEKEKKRICLLQTIKMKHFKMWEWLVKREKERESVCVCAREIISRLLFQDCPRVF